MKKQVSAKAKKQKLIPLSKMKEKAQMKFNQYIRLRDSNLPCISCGVGAPEHAGHYYPRGLYTGLSFLEINVNGQCSKCNTFLHGNLINYRKGLVRKYGADAVASLEAYAEKVRLYKWSREELASIYQKYNSKLNDH